MPLGDVSSTYSDIVETVFSSTIAAKAWLARGGRRGARDRQGADRGVMPAGVVNGQDAADVAPYVAGIAQ